GAVSLPSPSGFRHSSFGFPHTAQRLSAGRMVRFSRFPKSIGEPLRLGNMTPDLRLPLPARWNSRRLASGAITGIAPRLFRVLGSVMWPFQIDRVIWIDR